MYSNLVFLKFLVLYFKAANNHSNFKSCSYYYNEFFNKRIKISYVNEQEYNTNNKIINCLSTNICTRKSELIISEVFDKKFDYFNYLEWELELELDKLHNSPTPDEICKIKQKIPNYQKNILLICFTSKNIFIFII